MTPADTVEDKGIVERLLAFDIIDLDGMVRDKKCDPCWAENFREVQRAYAERLMAEARAKAIEECANVARERASDGEHGTWQAQEGLIIADMIRALLGEKTSS